MTTSPHKKIIKIAFLTEYYHCSEQLPLFAIWTTKLCLFYKCHLNTSNDPNEGTKYKLKTREIFVTYLERFQSKWKMR